MVYKRVSRPILKRRLCFILRQYLIEKIVKEDKIIYTDILFTENSAIDEHGNEKKNFTPKYPNIQFLINQLGDIEKIVIGGYHFADCVKRVGETALAMGVNALVDLDLTDLFFGIYKQKDYFNIEEYNPEKYKEYWMKEEKKYSSNKFAEELFSIMYPSLCYVFNEEEKCMKKEK